MHITAERVMKLNPCSKYNVQKVLKLFGKRKELSHIQISKLKIPYIDKIWVLVQNHFLTHEQQILFSIFSAELALSAWEKKHYNDKRPRKALDAARNVLIEPSKTNKKAAKAAANSADFTASNAAIAAFCTTRVAAYPKYAASFAFSAAAGTANKFRKAQLKFLVNIISDNES